MNTSDALFAVGTSELREGGRRSLVIRIQGRPFPSRAYLGSYLTFELLVGPTGTAMRYAFSVKDKMDMNNYVNVTALCYYSYCYSGNIDWISFT